MARRTMTDEQFEEYFDSGGDTTALTHVRIANDAKGVRIEPASGITFQERLAEWDDSRYQSDETSFRAIDLNAQTTIYLGHLDAETLDDILACVRSFF